MKEERLITKKVFNLTVISNANEVTRRYNLLLSAKISKMIILIN